MFFLDMKHKILFICSTLKFVEGSAPWILPDSLNPVYCLKTIFLLNGLWCSKLVALFGIECLEILFETFVDPVKKTNF